MHNGAPREGRSWSSQQSPPSCWPRFRRAGGRGAVRRTPGVCSDTQTVPGTAAGRHLPDRGAVVGTRPPSCLTDAAAGLEGRPSHARDSGAVVRVSGGGAPAGRRCRRGAAVVRRGADAGSDVAFGSGRDFPRRRARALGRRARVWGCCFVDTRTRPGRRCRSTALVRGRSPVGVAGLKPGEYRVTLSHDGYAGVSRVNWRWRPGGPSVSSSLCVPAPVAVEAPRPGRRP